MCWGYNKQKQCDVPVCVENVVRISCNNDNSIVVTAEGNVICWGHNLRGQCDVPEYAKNIVEAHCVDAGVLALTQDGQVIMWGKLNFIYNNNPEKPIRTMCVNLGCAVLITFDGEVLSMRSANVNYLGNINGKNKPDDLRIRDEMIILL